MDMGSPDLPPADFIIDTLVSSARQPGTHGYTAYGGTPEYLAAIAAYYQKRFGVSLDTDTETVGLIGSKEGIFALSQVLLNPGDVALIPDPGYNTYSTGAWVAQAEIYQMPLLSENGYLPDLQAIPAEVRQRAKLIWVNYPNNPTGALASLDFFQELVDFARTHNLIIGHDAPYADVCFDGYRAPSIMQIPGAKDCAVEFNSLSKTYNMAGWRLGMAVGNPEVIGYIKRYKRQTDTAHFQPALAAGITALTGDQTWLDRRNAVYQRRRDLILSRLPEMGLVAHVPKAALYIWAKVPEGRDDYKMSHRMLDEIGVSTTPGSIYGENSRGYLRLTICIPEEKIEKALDRMAAWVKTTK